MVRDLDLDLLRTLVAIADTGGFTRAAERLGRSQSAISLRVARLERVLGRRLVERRGRRVALSADGELLLAHARPMLRLNDEAMARLAGSSLSGTVRLGTPEDFATHHLPAVLAAFARSHPAVALEVTTDLTLHLLDRFAAGEFDLVLVKRERIGPLDGMRVWREPLVWAALDPPAARAEVLPLVVSPSPCVYRRRATRALDEAGRRWRIAYTSTSLAGAQAAVRAGLGLSVLPRAMVPPGLVALGQAEGLPRLPDTEIALMKAPGDLSPPATLLAGHIADSLEQAMPSEPSSAPWPVDAGL